MTGLLYAPSKYLLAVKSLWTSLTLLLHCPFPKFVIIRPTLKTIYKKEKEKKREEDKNSYPQKCTSSQTVQDLYDI